MLVSMNWIGDFVDLSGLDKAALIRRFTLSTAEVEEVIPHGQDTHGVVVAEIASVEKHPASAKLHLLKVNTGRELADCVCGAPNVRVGMRVAFARAGGAVCGTPIEHATVAGYESFGMCCSEAELGISADHSGLMEIFDDAPLGTDIKALYDIEDLIFEVDNKSLTNRPDLWGHYGMAREFAALADRPLRPVPLHDMTVYRDLPAVPVEVREPELCYRYTAIRVENIRRPTSPVNMRIRLFYCGSRSINFLADLTNYVMLELGQPMHAFDSRLVDRIVVRRFDRPFAFRTLDGVEREVDGQSLMICAGEVPVAVAGVMGGLDSGITPDTSALLLESATFNPVSVRKTAGRLGLRTDASMRYEKTLDPELAEVATGRFLQLLFASDPEVRVTHAFSDAYVRHYDPITLELDKAFVDRYTGIDIAADRIEATLRALGFGVVRTGDAFVVRVPSWRATKDVTIKADLIEEITRIYGYDNFQITTTQSPLRPVRREAGKRDEIAVKDLLVLEGRCHEVHSYLWSDAAKDRALGIEPADNVRLLNAQTPDHAVLRRSMIPSLLAFAAENKGHADGYGLFEIGHVVQGLDEHRRCREKRMLGVVLLAREQTEEAVFLRLRDLALALCRHCKHQSPVFSELSPAFNWQHPANTYALSLGSSTGDLSRGDPSRGDPSRGDLSPLGVLGVLHPAVAEKIDRKGAVAYLELDMDAFAAYPALPRQYREPSRFPGIDIDLSFYAELGGLNFEAVAATARAAAARTAGGEWLCDLSVADLYEGAEGSSLTLRFSFSSKERTLTKAELQDTVQAIIVALADRQLTFKDL